MKLGDHLKHLFVITNTLRHETLVLAKMSSGSSTLYLFLKVAEFSQILSLWVSMILVEAMWQLVLNLFSGYGEATVKLDKQHAFEKSNEKTFLQLLNEIFLGK